MSGIVSGLGTVFKTVGSGIARVSQAVTGVAGTVFASGAAAGSVPAAAQGFGGSTLGRILTGAVKQAGIGALAGGAIGAVTGQGFGKGALIGGLGGAVSGGLMTAAGMGGPQGGSGSFPPAPSVPGVATADTPTGVAPTGMTGPRAAASGVPGADVSGAGALTVPGTPTAASAPQGNGFGRFLTSETGGRLIAGLGKGLGSYMQAKQEAEEAEKDRQFLREKQHAITAGYDIDPAVLHSPAQDSTSRPKPSDKFARMRFNYDPQRGMVVAG